ncbi:MAG TPA: CHAT domain-containing protein [Thermoanaerobaculia bacterium]|nr:CHAT domain-containing protein [Thermoanaerobaculia bacterium]
MTDDVRAAACPDPDTLAAFAEGNLKRRELPPILEHLSGCVRCMAAVEAVTEDLGGGQKTALPAIRRWWLLAAAAVAVMVMVPVTREMLSRRSPMHELLAAAPRSARRVEPRLAGGFPWAAYAGADRAVSGTMDAEQMKLIGAAGDLVARADRDGGADAQHAAGVAMVLVLHPADAVTRLEAAAATSRDPNVWSDLAAARYAAAAQLGRASLYPRALAAADTALRINAALPEALFNRALILERLGLTDEAARAWRRYLEVDPSSPWADEARARLKDIPASTRSSQFKRDRPLIERAVARGDINAVRQYVDADRDRARAYAETEYLGLWGEAVQRQDMTEAARCLALARGIANALAGLSGESLLGDAVRSIDGATASERTTIAAAHVAYRAGRIAYSRRDLDGAWRELPRASDLFTSARDPMALAARYYTASIRLARNETAAARIDLERARTEIAAHPTFVNLGAQVRWELGRAEMFDDDWAAAVPLLTEGAAMFRQSDARASEAFVESLLARALASLGRADDAWLARIRAFAALSAEGEHELLATTIAAAMHAELRSGRSDAALALSGLARSAASASARPDLVIDALVNESMLETVTGHPNEAMALAREAGALARATPDAALRDGKLAAVAAATGAAAAGSDPRGAVNALTEAIAFYRQHEMEAFLPEPLLLRARAASGAGDTASAMRDLEAAMAVVERPHGGRDGVAGAGFLDAEHAVFTDALRLSLDRGDTAAAFAFAERSRGGSITIAGLQRRLAGSGAAVIEIVAVPGELVTFAVSEKDVVVARRARAIDTIAALADQTLSEPGTAAASALYDDVIRPVEAVVAHARQLIIVPDARLRSAPFSALYDSGTRRRLIERCAVSVASSAASLERDVAPIGTPSVVAIALPGAGATLSSALPEADRETHEVSTIYRHAQTIPPDAATLAALRNAGASADVLHIAGHTEQQPGGGEQALLLTADAGGGNTRATWKTIASLAPIHASVIVLAACETLRPPSSAATHALSLGEAFLSAGAADVIGTLAPIGDRDARVLFAAFHRLVANGSRPADALRAVQQEAIAASAKNDGPGAWRAVALLTRRIHAPNH